MFDVFALFNLNSNVGNVFLKFSHIRVAIFQLRLPMVSLSRSLTIWLAPLMNVLF